MGGLRRSQYRSLSRARLAYSPERRVDESQVCLQNILSKEEEKHVKVKGRLQRVTAAKGQISTPHSTGLLLQQEQERKGLIDPDRRT